MVKRLILTAITALALSASAQDWGLNWISCPTAGPTDQIWFRRPFVIKQRPDAARLTIACSGRFDLFVNGYNVSTDVLMPGSYEPSDTVRLMTFEVGRYLRPDTNVVAVWYSPARPTRKQIALTLNGSGFAGSDLAVTTDRTWLCRPANARTETDGSETIDDNAYVDYWNRKEVSPLGWQFAEEPTGLPPSPLAIVPLIYHARRICRITRYTFLDDYGHDLAYYFGHNFDGWVRVTLRGMNSGDTLRINGLTYVCSGRTDEQACRQFTSAPASLAVINGPEGFSRENVANIEAIDIETYLHTGYLY